MQKIFIFLVITTQICFASPFDITDQDDEKIPTQIPDNTIPQTAIKDDKIFISTDKAKFSLISIKDGSKRILTLNVGDKILIQDINIELQSCYLEADSFYNKISTAECLVNGQYIKFSNDFNLGNMEIKDMLFSLECEY